MISSQPKTCELSASTISQPVAPSDGVRSRSPATAPNSAAADRRRQRGVEERPGRPAQVTARLAQREQEARVRDAGQHAEDRPERRVRTVRALLEDAGDEDDADADDRDRRERGTRRALAEHGPREHRDEHDLRVPEHGREPGADLLDRVVPEDQVGREEDARRPRDQSRAARARPVAPVLEAGDQPERRQRPETAEERTGAGRHLRVAIEDRRERDRERTREHERNRSPAERRRGHAVVLPGNEKAGRHIARSLASSGAPAASAPRSSIWKESPSAAPRLIPPPFADSLVRFTFSPTWGRRDATTCRTVSLRESWGAAAHSLAADGGSGLPGSPSMFSEASIAALRRGTAQSSELSSDSAGAAGGTVTASTDIDPGITVMSTSSVSPLRATRIVEPGSSSRPSTKSASGSSMWRWIARRSGRAPIAGS